MLWTHSELNFRTRTDQILCSTALVETFFFREQRHVKLKLRCRRDG